MNEGHADAYGGLLEFDGNAVTVTNTRWPDKGEVTFPVQSIAGITVRRPSRFRNGEIKFHVPGASDRRRSGSYWTKTADDESGRYTLYFTDEQEPAICALRDQIERARADTPPHSVPAGWYPSDGGRLRWWDGRQWTEHYAPALAQR